MNKSIFLSFVLQVVAYKKRLKIHLVTFSLNRQKCLKNRTDRYAEHSVYSGCPGSYGNEKL